MDCGKSAGECRKLSRLKGSTSISNNDVNSKNKINAMNHKMAINLACQTAKTAYFFALKENKPSDETRRASCKDAYWGLSYAKSVDKGPHDETRKASCKEPQKALQYAISIDKKATMETAKSAFQDYATALEYKSRVYVDPRDKNIADFISKRMSSRGGWKSNGSNNDTSFGDAFDDITGGIFK